MSDSAPRYTTPLEAARPPGARLLEAFSPKLGRRVRLFDRAAFHQWIRLEADPSVRSLCERPARLGRDRDDRLVDFWVLRSDREEMLLVGLGTGGTLRPDHVDGVPLRMIAPAELAAANNWVSNWQRILPVITAARPMLSRSLAKAILAFVREPTPLAVIEHQLAIGDPPVVRGAIFELLRTGLLDAPTLHTQSLALHTLLEPVT